MYVISEFPSMKNPMIKPRNQLQGFKNDDEQPQGPNTACSYHLNCFTVLLKTLNGSLL